MPIYIYQALTKTGKRESGQIDAPTSAAAREHVASRGLYVTKLEMLDSMQAAAGEESVLGRLLTRTSLKEQIFFTRQLSVLLRSGIPLNDALTLLIDQTEGRFKKIVTAVRDLLREGSSLADAMARYPSVFPRIYVQLVKAGEASGTLEKILDRLAQYLERKDELAKSVRSATRGPLIQLVVLIGVTFFLMYLIVPQIAQAFTSQRSMRIPWFTQIVIALSTFIRSHTLMIIAVPVLLFVLYKLFVSSSSGKYVMDVIKLKLPIASHFTRVGAMVQFSRTLGVLLESGVTLSVALDIVCSIVDNQVLVKTLQQAKESIIKQGRFTEYLRQTGIFSPSALYLINTGEQSGQLDKMLLLVAEYNERELAEYAAALTARLNPALTILMGVMVVGVLAAVLVPLLQFSGSIGA